ncbi:HD-GYP domain-containing protein [Halobacillus sp. A1]|uniref:HD-GYP domain-containing protein n=1 Tax=Halobacillus sp. A1 TaxID=2880262 RepID=UPI0020A67365|nr:HD-GYP domain-containing protein [Halobacillus sp. A1]MCP3032238.1 HD-GYP domain-containing protein [Halobacillus sp. A1]
MEVHPSQLISGCILTKDVKGKTNSPIIPKHTVLDPIHIHVLHEFLIAAVEVGPKLSNGQPFVPDKKEKSPPRQDAYTKKPEIPKDLSFHEYYLEAVKSYEQWFEHWQGGSSIDMKEIRTFMVPLIEQAVHSTRDVFLLHHYSTEANYLAHHSVATGLISAYLAAKLGYSRGDWLQAGLAGLLSDCGMARIDTRVLHKSNSLDEEEYEEVKKHAAYSYRLVENIPSLSSQAKLGILQHHERLDGSGYPLGLRQNKIHQFAQIIAVSDMYHAMTSERVYRKKQSPYKVLEEIIKAQFGRYDHTVIQLFVKEMTNFSTGTKVRLTSSQIGEIIFIDPAHPTRPMVQLEENGEIIALSQQSHVHIDEVVES